jgi:flagellar hook-length control protein FliK
MKQEDDQTTLMFFAKNALVREALESTLQRLQKSFIDDGLDLDQAFVSDQSLAEHKEQNDYGFEQEGQPTNNERADSLASREREGMASERLLVAANDYRIDVWA